MRHAGKGLHDALVTSEAAAVPATHQVEDGGLLAGGQGRHFHDDGPNQRSLQLLKGADLVSLEPPILWVDPNNEPLEFSTIHVLLERFAEDVPEER